MYFGCACLGHYQDPLQEVHMIHLKKIGLPSMKDAPYPFSVPALNQGGEFSFDASVTVFIGENGCGKSTMLNLIAAKAGLYKIAMQEEIHRDKDKLFRNAGKNVTADFRLGKPSGFYFSAEDFTSYIHSLEKEKNYAREELARVRSEYAGKSAFSRMMASAPFENTLNDIGGMYQKDLLTSSHGEAYLDFFASRMRKGQLYLLDEPETPLSVQNQLALLAIIDEAIREDCQFILATHSPILMGIPEAALFEFSKEGIRRTTFSEVESIRLLRQYLANPSQFFDYLRKAE